MARGEDEEDEAEHERQMHAAMRDLAQQTEAGRVVVEERQDQQQPAHEHPRPARHLAELHFRIELFLQAGEFVDGGLLEHRGESSPPRRR